MSLTILLNPANAFIAMSATLAGYCLFRFYAHTAGNQLVVPYLLAASALLAMADSAWRAIFTASAEKGDDSILPSSGLISPTASYFTAVFMTLAGFMCAMTGGYDAFRAAGAAILLMLARSALFRKTEILSPLLGGMTKGMFFIIGMTAHPSFAETLFIGETRMPAAFFAVYMIIASVLAQVRESPGPRGTAAGGEPIGEPSPLPLETHDSAIEGPVPLFAGAALALMPLALAWIMPWRWLSWAILVFHSLLIVVKLIPALVYRSRKDFGNFLNAIHRSSALLNAGGVASLGDYRLREIYGEWAVPLPGRDQLTAVAIIILLSAPAWLLRLADPAD